MMRISLNYRNPTPAHCDVAVFINSAFTGTLKLRREELGDFQQLMVLGARARGDSFSATGNPDPRGLEE